MSNPLRDGSDRLRDAGDNNNNSAKKQPNERLVQQANEEHRKGNPNVKTRDTSSAALGQTEIELTDKGKPLTRDQVKAKADTATPEQRRTAR